MSKGGKQVAVAQAVSTTVVLPQFPRCDDAKVQRAKWIQDYERVQSELLRSHLPEAAGGASSATLSLRQLPNDWEDQMRQQQAQKAQLEAIRKRALEKKRKERNHMSAVLNGTSAAGSPPKNSNTNASMASSSLGASFYKSGPKASDERSPSANSRRPRERYRAATTDLYSANQSTFANKSQSTPPRSRTRSGHATAPSPIRPTTAGTSMPRGPAYSRLTLSPTRTRDSGIVVNESVTTTFTASRLPTTAECARILNNLILPPAHFKASVQPNLAHIDLRWAKRYKPGDPVTCELTLDSMREDIFTMPSNTRPALNSPRSVIVLLRNGCSVEDLQARPAEWFRSGKNKYNTAHNSSSLALGPSSQSMEMNEEMAQMAQKHYEERRNQLSASLRAEYRNLCREVSLLDLVETSLNLRGSKGDDDDGVAIDVTFLNERKERLVNRRALEMEQFEKQQTLAEQLRRKVAESEEKRYLADLEHKRLVEARREAAFARQREAEKKQEQLRQQTDKLQEEHEQRVQERRIRLEAKEQKMIENRIAHRDEVRRIAQSKTQKREARMERQRELQEELVHELEARRREQDEAEKERWANKEKAKQLHLEQIAAAQKLANERRQESKRAAEEHEEEIRARAVEKADQVATKMHEFHVKQKQKRAEQAAEEARKNEQRQRTQEQANERLSDRKDAFVAKRSAHEQRYTEMEAAQKHQSAKEQERERQDEDDKRMYVKRRTLAVQFDQLMSIANIERKREKGEMVTRQRDKLVDITLKEREKLRLQRERYDEELYTKTVSNRL